MTGEGRTRLWAGIGIVLLGTSLAAPAGATAGYFALGYSAAERGMAGAGIAYGLDAMSATTNPANVAGMGKEFSLGLQLFSPTRGYTGTGTVFVPPGKVESGRNLFPVPNFAYNLPLANGNVLNFAAYGNGGMNTSYPTGLAGCGSVFCAGPAGVDLMQLFLSVTYAGRTGNLSWGIAPTIAVQSFEATGLAAFAGQSVSPGNLSDNGHEISTGVGLRAGLSYEINPQLSLGATVQSRMKMSAFSRYSGLFADGGRFDIPAMAGVGVAFHPDPTMTVAVDVERIFYSDVGAVGNSPTAGPLGAPGGAGFGWKDVTVAKLGVEWKASPQMTWRAGYAHSTNPVQPSGAMLNILAPGIVTDHFSFGGTRRLSDRDSLDFAIEYVPEHTLTGPEMTPGSSVELFMHQVAFSVGWTRRF